MTRTTVLVLTLVLGGAAAARADVVEAPPATCPAGSSPATCHGGPYCAPLTCSSDADCTGGASCREVKACIQHIPCYGRPVPDADASDLERDALIGFCANGSACSGSSACQTLRLCQSNGGSGCAVLPARPRRAVIAALAMALGAGSLCGFLIRRRRTHR